MKTGRLADVSEVLRRSGVGRYGGLNKVGEGGGIMQDNIITLIKRDK